MILKAVATGLGVTHASLSSDLAEANYSSLRAGLLPERDEWRMGQDYLVEHCHRRVYEAWLDMALLTGRLKAGMRDPEGLKEVRWEPRGWAWVDPKNEMDAHIVAIANGLTSRQNVMAESGLDLEETFVQLELENKLAAEHGIDVTPTARTSKPAEEKDDEDDDRNAKSLKMA
jgi:lambda family phage portal protein